MTTSYCEMDARIERRTGDRDPADVLTPEVVALLKLCGGMRQSDLVEAEPIEDDWARDRRRADRRGGTKSRRAGELLAVRAV